MAAWTRAAQDGDGFGRELPWASLAGALEAVTHVTSQQLYIIGTVILF